MKLVSWLKEWREERRIARIINGDLISAWQQIKDVWSKADYIYCGPVGFAAIFSYEFKVLLKFIEKYDCEALLLDGLRSENPRICAYCLVALERKGSQLLAKIPDELLARQEKVTWRLCSREYTETLGDFAKTYQLDYQPPIYSTNKFEKNN